MPVRVHYKAKDGNSLDRATDLERSNGFRIQRA